MTLDDLVIYKKVEIICLTNIELNFTMAHNALLVLQITVKKLS